MEMTRTAAAILAAACVTAGAAGGYLAMRDTPRAVASADLPVEAVPFEGVEQSEVAVQPPVVPEPEPPASDSPRPRGTQQATTPPAPEVPRTPERVPDRPRVQTPPPAAAPTAAPAPDPALEIAQIAPAVIAPPRLPFEPQPAPAPVETAGPQYEEFVVAADSVIGLQVESTVSSETAQVEDPVTARVTRDVKIGDHVVIPAGARARGEVTLVDKGGKVRERARLGVRFTSIVLGDGTQVPISTDTIVREGDAPGRESATKIGGGAIGGAIIGGILGGAKGAAIGGAIGGGAGSAAVMAGGRNPATLSSGAPVTIRLEEPATVTIQK
jgi:hypothetical protein